MKKLSELVAFSQNIKALYTDDSAFRLSLTNIVDDFKEFAKYDYSKIDELSTQVFKLIDEINKEIAQQRARVHSDIESNEKDYFLQSYKIYEESIYDTSNWILSRHECHFHDTTYELNSRIKLYTDWKFPGVYIRPAADSLVDSMITCDPLYILDHSVDLLEPVKNRWNSMFQSRVRYKTINDDSEHILKDLPAEQIGLIVATGFFDYKPLEIIQKYLEEFKKVLRPGGVVVLTYNNCDMAGSVRNVENFYNTYVPGRLLQRIVEGLGFEVLYANEDPSGINWIEFKTPGEIASVRGGQALAQIKDSRLDN